MKSLRLFLYVVATAFITFHVVFAACPPPSTPCPVGRAENDPPNAPLRVCSGHGRCVSGACQCNLGFADVDCGAVFRRTKLASVFISQGGFDDGPTRYFDIITQVVELLRREG